MICFFCKVIAFIWASLVVQSIKSLPANRRPRLDPWIVKITEEGNGNLLQDSCLGNLMNRRAWWATVHGVTRVRHDLVTKTIYLDFINVFKNYSEKWLIVLTRQSKELMYRDF